MTNPRTTKLRNSENIRRDGYTGFYVAEVGGDRRTDTPYNTSISRWIVLGWYGTNEEAIAALVALR